MSFDLHWILGNKPDKNDVFYASFVNPLKQIFLDSGMQFSVRKIP